MSSAPIKKQEMGTLQGSVVASPQLPNAGCMGRDVGLVVQMCPPSAVPRPQPGPSAGLRLCCTGRGVAPTPLLHLIPQVKGLMMYHDMLFPDFHVFSGKVSPKVWGKLLVAVTSLSSLPQKYTKTATSYWLQERRMTPVKSHTVLPFSPVKNKHDIISQIIK